MEEKKELEIVSGDGKNLDISPVYNNLNELKPKSTHDNKPSNIVIPKETHKPSKKKKEEKGDKN